MAIYDSLWVEKYRPKSLDQVVLPDDYKQKFEEYIKTKSLPHILLYGSPGSGKTTIARILCDNLVNDTVDLLVVDGSKKSERSLEHISTNIESFCQVAPIGIGNKFRIVFIDEADNLTIDAFKALRGPLERYAKNVRFIWTCNYIEKIPSPIQSRFQLFEFKQFSKEYVLNLCEDILVQENVLEYNTKTIKLLVDALFPDIRRIINTLQKKTIGNKLQDISPDELVTIESNIIDNILSLIESRKRLINNPPNQQELLEQINLSILNIQQLLKDKENIIDWVRLYTQIFNNDKIPVPVKIICNTYFTKHTTVISPVMNFMAFVYEILQMSNDLINITLGTGSIKLSP